MHSKSTFILDFSHLPEHISVCMCGTLVAFQYVFSFSLSIYFQSAHAFYAGFLLFNFFQTIESIPGMIENHPLVVYVCLSFPLHRICISILQFDSNFGFGDLNSIIWQHFILLKKKQHIYTKVNIKITNKSSCSLNNSNFQNVSYLLL